MKGRGSFNLLQKVANERKQRNTLPRQESTLRRAGGEAVECLGGRRGRTNSGGWGKERDINSHNPFQPKPEHVSAVSLTSP